VLPPFTETMPALMRRPARMACVTSLVKTAALSPNWEALASSMASSRLSTASTEKTGPKISSSVAMPTRVSISSSVGSMKGPRRVPPTSTRAPCSTASWICRSTVRAASTLMSGPTSVVSQR